VKSIRNFQSCHSLQGLYLMLLLNCFRVLFLFAFNLDSCLNFLCDRALEEKRARLGLLECVNHDLLQPYPVLHEKPGKRCLVSHLSRCIVFFFLVISYSYNIYLRLWLVTSQVIMLLISSLQYC